MKEDHSDLRNIETNLYYGRYTDGELQAMAYKNVRNIRGSDDVPGFKACVALEYVRLKKLNGE